MDEFVFGYGSLSELAVGPLTRAPDPRGYVTDLRDHRRRWGVARDNRETIAGYPHWVRPDGSRPPLYVAFLDVVGDPGACVNGVCLPIASAQLAALDLRERNYERADVTAQIAQPPGRVWTYIGSPAGRARLVAGREAGTAVISAQYWEIVRAGFARLGAAELARLCADAEPHELPICPLRRAELL